MTHSPDSHQNATPPPENARSVGQVEFIVENAINTLSQLALNDPDARAALRRLRQRICGECA